MKNNRAFTLIELLVVVLIIGILSAIALPQYQKAVWKSKNVQLKELVRAVSQAQQVYYLANDEYADKLDDLDINLPLTPHTSSSDICSLGVNGSTRRSKKGKDFAIALTASKRVWGLWTSGPYECKGFVGPLIGSDYQEPLHCVEIGAKKEPSDFCEKLEGAVFAGSTNSRTHYYSIR